MANIKNEEIVKRQRGPQTKEELMLEEKEQELRSKELDLIEKERMHAVQEEEKTLLSWKSPARPFKKRNQEYFTTIGAIVILLSVILFFAREFLVIAVLLAFAFLAYVLASVEPEDSEHEISTRGIVTGGKFYPWGYLGRFWYQDKFGHTSLVIETFLRFPKHLVILLNGQKKEEITSILKRYVLNETPQPGFLDKASGWLSEKVPLEE